MKILPWLDSKLHLAALYMASIGEDQRFIAYMAHCWFAFSMAYLAHGNPFVIAALVAIFALKEFWFDLRYEANPPQTFDMSLEDFAGYATGLILGMVCVFFNL